MTIYNTYRPHTFSDVLGQKHIVQILENAVNRNIIGHAYLFTGPRGTGKTTLGRIFAHAINCVPRDGFDACDTKTCAEIINGSSLDIIEIDAASHTSVDNIREIRDTVAMPPSRTKYKIYIIDEAHMLSTAAWNALLKTLEEPPAHAIFIFATTEVHKVPETILSRVQRFDLGRISINDITKKLLRIARSEGISIDPEGASMIAIASSGSMRDAESLLAQMISFTEDNITASDVRTVLGITKHDTVFLLIKKIIQRDTTDALKIIAEIAESGHDITLFTTSILTVLRYALITAIIQNVPTEAEYQYDETEIKNLKEIATLPSSHIVTMIDTIAQAHKQTAQSPIPQLPLEIAIIKLTRKADVPPSSTHSTQDTNQKNEPSKGISSHMCSTSFDKDPLQAMTEIWPQVLRAIKKDNAAFATLLQKSAPHTITGNTLKLVTSNPLLVEKLKNKTFHLTLQTAIATICEKQFAITADVIAKEPTPSLIASAMQVMNGGKISESVS